MTETQIKIIEAAEAVFARRGFEGASIREITKRAGVNVAAVNYHFGSKAKLFTEMMRHRIEPINRLRLDLLEQAESANGGKPLPTRRIIEIMVRPMLEAMLSDKPDACHFMKAMGRGLTEERGFMASMRQEVLGEVIARFRQALARTHSELSDEQLSRCFHYLSCTLVGSMMQHNQLSALREGPLNGSEMEEAIHGLVTYLTGGIEHLAAAYGEAKSPPEAKRSV